MTLPIKNADNPMLKIGLVAPNKAYLAGYLDAMKRKEPLCWTVGMPRLEYLAPCGTRVRFDNPDDLPEETLPCACGDPKCIGSEYRGRR